jgi:hypothetical protein
MAESPVQLWARERSPSAPAAVLPLDVGQQVFCSLNPRSSPR